MSNKQSQAPGHQPVFNADDADVRALAELMVDVYLQRSQTSLGPDQPSDRDTETTPKLPEPHL